MNEARKKECDYYKKKGNLQFVYFIHIIIGEIKIKRRRKSYSKRAIIYYDEDVISKVL